MRMFQFSGSSEEHYCDAGAKWTVCNPPQLNYNMEEKRNNMKMTFIADTYHCVKQMQSKTNIRPFCILGTLFSAPHVCFIPSYVVN